jgi:hypothetical protein
MKDLLLPDYISTIARPDDFNSFLTLYIFWGKLFVPEGDSLARLQMSFSRKQ